MKVQTISSNQNFQGHVSISRNLNSKVAGYMLGAAQHAGIANKPFNIEIKNIEKGKFLSIEAINPNNLKQKYTVLVQDFLQRKDILKLAMQDAIANYEKNASSQNKNINKVI